MHQRVTFPASPVTVSRFDRSGEGSWPRRRPGLAPALVREHDIDFWEMEALPEGQGEYSDDKADNRALLGLCVEAISHVTRAIGPCRREPPKEVIHSKGNAAAEQ